MGLSKENTKEHRRKVELERDYTLHREFLFQRKALSIHESTLNESQIPATLMPLS